MSPGLLDPFDALSRLQKALDASRMGDWLGMSTASRGGFPPVNVFEKSERFAVVAELPGLDRKSLTVEIHRNQLRLAGRRIIEFNEGVSLHRRERLSGDFDRTLTFPVAIDRDSAAARYRDGILIVELSRAASDKPRSIDIG